MDIRRLALFMALAFVGMSLWTSWKADYPQATEIKTETSQTTSDGQLLPRMTADNTTPPVSQDAPITPNTKSSDIVHVKTDVLDVDIDLQQGDIIGGQLLDFPQSNEEKNKPFTLLQNDPAARYVANSSLFTVDGQSIKTLNLSYQTAQNHYVLNAPEKELVVTLQGAAHDGLAVKKEFIFTQGSYLIHVRYQLANQGNDDWKGYMNTQLLRSFPKEDKSSMFHVGSYTGASYSNPKDTRYQKIGFDKMKEKNLELDANNGWVAMQQHYFLSAWIPATDTTNKFYTRAQNGDYTIGFVSQPIVLKPNEQKSVDAKLYLGPEDTATLKDIAPYLDLTIDYGIFWLVSSALFSVMRAINNFVGNWGLTIVLVTILIKALFYRLSATSYKSMANMRKLQPKLQALRERYGDDKAKISQATMELYRQEKVNPLGGCLPILIQIPVFIALYWVLLESVELRQAPFMLWINDLSSPDAYHVLPVIMGLTMLIQQRLNPAPPDPVQAKVMMFLPVLFTALFWSFPSGLVLYWIVNNTLSIAQQWYITRKYTQDKPIKKLATAK